MESLEHPVALAGGSTPVRIRAAAPSTHDTGSADENLFVTAKITRPSQPKSADFIAAPGQPT